MKNKNESMSVEKYQVDLGSLGDLMLAARDESKDHIFLDTETGRPEILPHSLLNAVASENASALRSLPDEERDLTFMAKKILEDSSGRYIDLPEISLLTEYEVL